MASQTFEEQYELMVKKQLGQMVQAFLDAQKSAHAQKQSKTTPTTTTAKTSGARGGGSETKIKQEINKETEQTTGDEVRRRRNSNENSRQAMLRENNHTTVDHDLVVIRNQTNYRPQNLNLPYSAVCVCSTNKQIGLTGTKKCEVFQTYHKIVEQDDLENLNKIELPSRENAREVPVKVSANAMLYIDRARRSISVEARQANLIDQIAQFNDIPKKYEIKFDLTGFQQQTQESAEDGEDDDQDKSSLEQYKATLSEVECAPMVEDLQQTETNDDLVVKGTSSLYVHDGAFQPQSPSTSATTTTFKEDYAGKVMSQVDLEALEITTGEEEGEVQENYENSAEVKLDEHADHIIDRLVTMLLQNNRGEDDFENNTNEYEQQNLALEQSDDNLDNLLQNMAANRNILRTSGQAKSVRCLSSHMRQANQQKMIFQQNQIKYQQQLQAQQEKQQLVTEAAEQRQRQMSQLVKVEDEEEDQSEKATLTLTIDDDRDDELVVASAPRQEDQDTVKKLQPDEQQLLVQQKHRQRMANHRQLQFNHSKNQSSLATPVMRGLKSADLDSAVDYPFNMQEPFEYGVTEDNRRLETQNTAETGHRNLNKIGDRQSSEERLIAYSRRPSGQSSSHPSKGNNISSAKVGNNTLAKQNKSTIQRNLRMSLTSNHLKEQSSNVTNTTTTQGGYTGVNNSNNFMQNSNNNAKVIGSAKMPAVSRTTIYAPKDQMQQQNFQQSNNQNKNQQQQQPVLSSGSSQRSINFASCLSHRSQSNKQKLLVPNQNNLNYPPKQQNHHQQKQQKLLQQHQQTTVNSPFKHNNGKVSALMSKQKFSQQNGTNLQSSNNSTAAAHHSQTHANGFIRSTTINTSEGKVQFPNIQKKDSQKQLYPAAAKTGQQANVANHRIKSEQRQGVTRTNTTVFTTTSNFNPGAQNNHKNANSNKTNNMLVNHQVRKNLSSQPKVMTVGQVLLEQHQNSHHHNHQGQLVQQRTPQLPTINQQQLQQTGSSSGKGTNFQTIRPQLLKQNMTGAQQQSTQQQQQMQQKGNTQIMKRASGITTNSAGGIHLSQMHQAQQNQNNQQQQQQSRLAPHNQHSNTKHKHQTGVQESSSSHSTRPARIYTAKLTSGNLKQFFFNNNNQQTLGKKQKVGGYSPKNHRSNHHNHIQQQHQNLQLSNQEDQQLFLQQSASQMTQQQNLNKQQQQYTSGGHQVQNNANISHHRSYLMQLSSKKPHSGGHHPTSAISSHISTKQQQLSNTNNHHHNPPQQYQQQVDAGMISSDNRGENSNGPHQIVRMLTQQTNAQTNNVQNQSNVQTTSSTTQNEQQQIYAIHYSSSQTQLQQLNSQEFGGLLDPQQPQIATTATGGPQYQQQATNLIMGGKQHGPTTRNTLNLHPNRKTKITNTQQQMQANATANSQQSQQQQQQQSNGNPRRTLYSAKQVSQVYRPQTNSHIMQGTSNMIHTTNSGKSTNSKQVPTANSSATKTKLVSKQHSGSQALNNVATTLKMMQQTHQTQLFNNLQQQQQQNAAANNSNNASNSYENRNNGENQNQPQRLLIQQQHSSHGGTMAPGLNKTTNQSSATKTKNFRENNNNKASTGNKISSPSSSHHLQNNHSGKTNGIMRQSQVLMSSQPNGGNGNGVGSASTRPSNQGMYVQQHESMVKLKKGSGGSPRNPKHHQVVQQQKASAQMPTNSNNEHQMNISSTMTPDLSQKIIFFKQQQAQPNKATAVGPSGGNHQQYQHQKRSSLNVTGDQHQYNGQGVVQMLRSTSGQQLTPIIATQTSIGKNGNQQRTGKNDNGSGKVPAHHNRLPHQAPNSRSTVPTSRIHSTLAQYNNNLMVNYDTTIGNQNQNNQNIIQKVQQAAALTPRND